MTTETTLISVRTVREPYRRANLQLGKTTQVFALGVTLAAAAIASIPAELGTFAGTITKDQFDQLSGDANVLLETRDIELDGGAAQKSEDEPLTTEQAGTLSRAIVETVDPLIEAEGFKPTASGLKALLKPVRAALEKAGFKADKVEHAKTETGFEVIAHYGEQSVNATFALEGGDA